MLLVLASVALMVVDLGGGRHSPLGPLRTVVGSAVGPVESAAGHALGPFADLGDTLRTNGSLRREVDQLAAENARLRGQVRSGALDRARLAEFQGLARAANETGYTLLAAHVVGLGAMQTFERTATLDAGSSSGLRADMTVVDDDGLVGRIVRVTRSTATVLLVVDPTSVVGARLGTNLEVGLLRGLGSWEDRGRLQLDLVDDSVRPSQGDTVFTWGSENGVPYVAGIPIGEVESVVSTPREGSREAVVRPFADFTSLDVVGVVVPADTAADRELIRPATAGGTR